MKWLTPILAILLLVGCSRNEAIPNPMPVFEQSEVSVSTNRGTIFSERYERGVPLPWVPPQPELPSQSTKDEQVQIQQRKIKGYRAKTDPATGRITPYPVYEDEKK